MTDETDPQDPKGNVPNGQSEIENQENVSEVRPSRIKKVIGGFVASLVCLFVIASLLPFVGGSEGASLGAKTELQRRQDLIDVALQTEAATFEHVGRVTNESHE